MKCVFEFKFLVFYMLSKLKFLISLKQMPITTSVGPKFHYLFNTHIHKDIIFNVAFDHQQLTVMCMALWAFNIINI